ncbi:MAG: FHA domain-containing serine/threonine-protein kinase [Bacteroidota bacterium]
MTGVLAEPLCGSTDKYFVEQEIGEGGFATVYKVRSAKNNNRYAAKVLKLWKQLPADVVEMSERFRMEYNIIKKLSSPYIVKAHDFGAHKENNFNEDLFMILDYCPNGTLENKINSIQQHDLREVVAAILKGMAVAHQNGIVHRDLKPENILFDQGHNVKITDFGIAADVRKRKTRRNWRGQVREVFATVTHSPPEQTNMNKAYHVYNTNDIFALGATIYQVITKGSFPFGPYADFEMDMGKTYQKRKEQGAWDRKTLTRNTTDHLWAELIERCLKPKPAERFQNAQQVLKFLGEGKEDYSAKSSYQPVNGHWALRVTCGEGLGDTYDLSDLAAQRGTRLIKLGWHDMNDPTKNDVGLTENHTQYISRKHATLEVNKQDGQEAWYIRDGQWDESVGGIKSSTNGTFINGQPIHSSVIRIQDGDIITVGDTTLKVICG